MKTFKWKLALCAIFLSILSAVCLTEVFSKFHNTLYNNGSWTVTKTQLKVAVMGAYGFLGSPNTLLNGHLDLSKWHGFQEVIYKDALEVQEVIFDFLLDQNAYLIFIFNKNSDGFSGIRISRNAKFRSQYLISKNSGEFVSTQELHIPDLGSRPWGRCKMVFEDKAFSLYINKIFVGKFQSQLLKNQYIGFRGGQNTVLIDNIVIRTKNARQSIFESFNYQYRSQAFLWFLTVGIFVNLMLLLYFLKHRRGKFNDVMSRIVVVDVYLVMISFLVLIFIVLFVIPRYPKNDSLMPPELKAVNHEYWRSSSVEFICKLIQERYSLKNRKNVCRILFLGTSQTWGAGASAESRTFVNLVESSLNKSSNNGQSYECINGGISGWQSSALLDLYIKQWIKLAPDIVVVNLSNNDTDGSVFARNLEKIIGINDSKNIRTLFILESNSIEYMPGSLRWHEVMKRIGYNSKVITLDLHGYLLRNHDKGFLWWDAIHLTDFGQELTAAYIVEELHKVMGAGSLY